MIALYHLFHPFRPTGPFWRRAARFGTSRMPLGFVRWATPCFAVGFALALPGARRKLRAHLTTVRPSRGRARDELDTFRTIHNFACSFAEGLTLAREPPPSVHVQVHGAEHFEAALRHGRGVVVLTAHTGSWEVASFVLRERFGVELLAGTRAEPDGEGGRVHDDARRSAGLRQVHVGSDPLGALPLVRHLKAGGAVGLQLDRVPEGMRALSVVLLGRPGRVPAGPFHLARVAEAPIVPCFLRRQRFLHYELEISEPLWLGRAGPSAAVEAAAQRAADAMGRFLQQHPTHWFHFVGSEPLAEGGAAHGHRSGVRQG